MPLRLTREKGFSEFCGAWGHGNLVPRVFLFSNMPRHIGKREDPGDEVGGHGDFWCPTGRIMGKFQKGKGFWLPQRAPRVSSRNLQGNRSPAYPLFILNAFNASLFRSCSPVVQIVSQKRKRGEIFLSSVSSRLIFVLAFSWFRRSFHGPDYSRTSVSDHPNGKYWVVAYGRRSFTRIEPQGVSSEKRSRHIYVMEDNLLHAMPKLRYV